MRKITPELKSEIFSHFDRSGIKLKELSAIRSLINLSSGRSTRIDYRTYTPFESKFGLTSNETIDIIIEYIYKTGLVELSHLDEIDKFPSSNGVPFLMKLNNTVPGEAIFCFAFGRIPGSVTIKGDEIVSLGNIEEINGDLGFVSSTIKSLGKLKKVNGSFWISRNPPFTNIVELENLERVEKDLSLQGSPIKSLSQLKYIGRTLNLRDTSLDSIGELKHVGWNVYLPKGTKIDFSSVKIVGSTRYYKPTVVK